MVILDFLLIKIRVIILYRKYSMYWDIILEKEIVLNYCKNYNAIWEKMFCIIVVFIVDDILTVVG